jgi:hypothetical protein
MKKAVLLLVLLLAPVSPVSSQSTKRVPVGIREANKAQDQFDKGMPPPREQVARPPNLLHDANELAALANSIPPAVTQLANGLRGRDLEQRLKRIEKLSKRLRSSLGRN